VDACSAGGSSLVLNDHRAGAAVMYDRAYAASREEAMAEFKARWGVGLSRPASPSPMRQCAITSYVSEKSIEDLKMSARHRAICNSQFEIITK